MSPEYPGSSRFDVGVSVEEREGAGDPVPQDLLPYLQDVMSDLRAPTPPSDMHADAAAVATGVVDLLFSRPFSYLGRSRARVYENGIRDTVVRAVERGAPIPFYFDIGGGYHATIFPGKQDFSFNVGLGELFVLTQIARLRHAAARFYAPNVRFSLVIDNLCALLVNDIPLAKTLAYCTRLRRLIEEQASAGVGNTLSPEERAIAWRESVKGLPDTKPLSDKAISRESIYAARG